MKQNTSSLFITRETVKEIRELTSELKQYANSRKEAYTRAFIRVLKREPKEFGKIVVF